MAKSKKAGLADYINTVQKIKPSAETKFNAKQPDGTTSETSAKKVYESVINSPEVKEASARTEHDIIEHVTHKSPEIGDLLSKIDSIAKERPEPEVVTEAEQVEEFEEPVHTEQMSPVAGQQPAEQPEVVAIEMKPDVALILEALAMLVQKIDDMQNFTPIIHVPAPVIHVTLPETRRTVTKAIERDANNLIKNVREQIEEVPLGDATIEIMEDED